MTESKTNSRSINNNSGYTNSLWMDIELPDFPILDQNLKAEVCIVGAGISGLTCAYSLVKKGKSVIVLERGAIAGGQTARTTAHLTWALDERFYKYEEWFGEDKARLAAESHSAAIDYIERIIQEEQINCDFERLDGYLFVPPNDSKDVLDKELAAVKKIGMEVHKIAKAPFSSFDTGTCLHFPRQAQFHILKYLQGLTKAILKYGGQIFAYSPVSSIEENHSCMTQTQTGNIIESQQVIVATCTPINNRFSIHTKLAPYRTYVIAATIPKGSIQKGLYWDTPEPAYHYIRLQKHLTDESLDWLIIGGEDHKTGQESEINDRYHILESWSRLRFPMMNEIAYRWSGQIFDPVDGLAYIGKNPGNQNIYTVTGDSGNGMTHGTIAGILLTDLILNRKSTWENLYDPSRKTLSTAGRYIKENLNMACQYRDWFTSGENKKIELLSPNSGMIMRKGAKKIAIFKDEKNKLHIKSALCPHLGGYVRWNCGEKSWDCPCHGSRFDGYGKVITGPSISDLSPYTNDEKI